MNMSTPLFRYSYRPAVNIYRNDQHKKLKTLGEKTHINRIVETKIVLAIKMASHKFVDLGFRSLMKILESVHRLELNGIQAVR